LLDCSVTVNPDYCICFAVRSRFIPLFIFNEILVIGYWSLVIGHWSLVIGHWLLVIGQGKDRPYITIADCPLPTAKLPTAQNTVEAITEEAAQETND